MHMTDKSSFIFKEANENNITFKQIKSRLKHETKLLQAGQNVFKPAVSDNGNLISIHS